MTKTLRSLLLGASLFVGMGAFSSNSALAASISNSSVSGTSGTDYYLYKATENHTVRDDSASLNEVLGGQCSSATACTPGGNVELFSNSETSTYRNLDAFRNAPVTSLNGTLAGQSITLSSLNGADWFTTDTGEYDSSYGKNTLANNWFNGALTNSGFGSLVGTTSSSYIFSAFQSNGGFQRFSDPNISYVNQDRDGLVRIGLAGHYNALPLLQASIQPSADQLQSSLNQLQASKTQVQTQLTQLQGQLTTQQQSVDGLNAQLTQQQTALKPLQDQLTTQQAALIPLNAQLTQQQATLTNLQAQRTQLVSRRASTTAIDAQIKSQNDLITKTFNQIKSQNTLVTQTSNQIKSQNDLITKTGNSIKTLNDSVAKITGQIQTASDTLKTVSDNINTVAGSLTLFNGFLSSLPQQVQASEIVKVSYGNNSPQYLYSFSAVQSGLTAKDDGFSHNGEYEVSFQGEKAVPEPSAVLGLIGLGGFLMVGRKQLKKAGS